MEAFKERARRRGRSVEQEVRLLIERAAAEDLAMERFVRKSERMLRTLRERGGSWRSYSASAALNTPCAASQRLKATARELTSSSSHCPLAFTHSTTNCLGIRISACGALHSSVR